MAAFSFNTHVGIPSGPWAFLWLSFESSSHTSPAVIVIVGSFWEFQFDTKFWKNSGARGTNSAIGERKASFISFATAIFFLFVE
jgi:hypothetical protein